MAALGMLEVRGDEVVFDSGMRFRVALGRSGIETHGVFEGWIASPRSTSDEIVWQKAGEGECRWFLEDDLEEDREDSCGAQGVVRNPRDMAGLDAPAPVKGRSQQLDLDGSVAEARRLFTKWVLSTATLEQEELLLRNGRLTTTLPVRITTGDTCYKNVEAQARASGHRGSSHRSGSHEIPAVAFQRMATCQEVGLHAARL